MGADPLPLPIKNSNCGQRVPSCTTRLPATKLPGPHHNDPTTRGFPVQQTTPPPPLPNRRPIEAAWVGCCDSAARRVFSRHRQRASIDVIAAILVGATTARASAALPPPTWISRVAGAPPIGRGSVPGRGNSCPSADEASPANLPDGSPTMGSDSSTRRLAWSHGPAKHAPTRPRTPRPRPTSAPRDCWALRVIPLIPISSSRGGVKAKPLLSPARPRESWTS
ncbi:hypothetical protein M433DRAFT_193775 [Acidomyces richmondensis BFW]|nr:MAG: hypothetical protein FE78DRAFT_215193 [Acidomyces sp. 'richmondensis']KYG40603.1 hypothetical protein M433DRAFT_193775 [Acidomyces richmondensis BFW]